MAETTSILTVSDLIFLATSVTKKLDHYKRGAKKSGVKRLNIHSLRHAHASLLIELGFSPLEIAERLGHEKIETTLNTYSHLYPQKQDQLADRLDKEYQEGLK